MIYLPPEAKLCGTLLNAAGKPAVGVNVQISGLLHKHPIDGVYFLDDAQDAQSSFPTKLITDDRGQIAVHGIPPATGVNFRLTGHNSNSTFWTWQPETVDPTFTLPESFAISGTVTAADTGLPIAGAKVTARDAAAITDAAGNFRMESSRASVIGQAFTITARPPVGSPFVTWMLNPRRHPGAVEEKVQFKVGSGVLVAGEVTEEDSGKPVALRLHHQLHERVSHSIRIDWLFVAITDADEIRVRSAARDDRHLRRVGLLRFVMRPVQIEHRFSPTQSVLARRMSLLT